MRTLKIAALAACALALPAAHATYSGGDSRPVKELASIALKAETSEGSVKLSWNAAPAAGLEGWQYWKVVRSATNSKPTYPEDGYIKYDSDASLSSYVDSDPKAGAAFYRVCAITSSVRYCSNVVKVGVSSAQAWTEKKYETGTKKEIPAAKAYGLAASAKTQLESAVSAVKSALDAKFGDDVAAKAAWISSKIPAVEALKAKAPLAVGYLLELLRKLRDSYQAGYVPADLLEALKVE